jgi:hypothetical protein
VFRAEQYALRRVLFALGVAVQVDPFESKLILKPGYHITGPRVETRRFQAMGSTGFNLYRPHLGRAIFFRELRGPYTVFTRGVAAQVDPFESKL